MPDGARTRAKAILIAGPTAGGKSALAAAAAERFDGVVVNADSMQVYAGLTIVSAQPDAADREKVPHVLFGHRDPAEPSSVAAWLGEARVAMERAWADGRPPILVGGTGLYFKALTQGLSPIPPVPDAVRHAVRCEAKGLTVADLHRRLEHEDPASAERLRPTDPQRILRALEVVRATGSSLTSFQAIRGPALLAPGDYHGWFLCPDRGDLNRRIDARFDDMMARGALDEVRALAARQLDPSLPAMRALGVPPLLAALRGDTPLEDAVAAAKAQTRAYAKRQMTFGRHQLAGFGPLGPMDWGRALAHSS